MGDRFTKYPLGVKIIGLLLLCYGVLAVIGIVYKTKTIIYIVSGLISGQIHIMGPKSFVELFSHNILKPIIFLMAIIANFGFLKLKNWARILALYIVSFRFLGLLGLMYAKNLVSIEHIISSIVLFALPTFLVIWYLTQERIKNLFIRTS